MGTTEYEKLLYQRIVRDAIRGGAGLALVYLIGAQNAEEEDAGDLGNKTLATAYEEAAEYFAEIYNDNTIDEALVDEALRILNVEE